MRPLVLLSLGCALALLGGDLRASDAISGPVAGASAVIHQPHVTAELIPKDTLVYAGKTAEVILHLHMDPEWHTYWVNTGDAGLATKIAWTLPPGWSAGPIQWPTPEAHSMGPLTIFGYGGDVYLPVELTIPASTTRGVADVTIAAKATWLVCQEACIPGKAELTLKLQVAGGRTAVESGSQSNHELFAAVRARLPVPNTRWDVKAAYQLREVEALVVRFTEKGTPGALGHLRFFPEQPNVLATQTQINGSPPQTGSREFELANSLQQNGDKPDHLSGVLVSDQALIGSSKSVYLSTFSTHDDLPPFKRAAAVISTAPTSLPAPPTSTVQPLLLAVLGWAFIGGLILNLMPCVLPVLSLKVFSLIRHAGEKPGSAWRQGAAFTVGVVLSFWLLAGLLLALRAAGNQLGWGFQMQSPGFVFGLILLFFLLGLNLLGVFEIGSSLVGLDAKATSRLGGLSSSFANGALATLAATPCTAPFMGSALGFAAQQPAIVSMLVFTFLALGMAAPYLLLTIFPAALRLVPKPGPWMESLRQVMGFLLLATVIYLVYVFGALVGPEEITLLLGVLLLAGVAAWIFGRWTPPVHSGIVRGTATILALALLVTSIAWGARLAQAEPLKSAHAAEGWQTYSADAVQAALAQKRPVFVDFTAAWCLSCKVNERVALDVDSTRQAFAQKNVVLLRGDWTHADPVISQTLRQFNRDGVPLYLLYSPKNPAAPMVLPEVLTPGLVQDALQKL